VLGLELPGTAVFDFPTPSALAAYCVAQLRPSQAADHAAVQLSRRMLVTSDRCHDLQYLPEYMCKHLICAMIHVGHVAGRGMQLCAWMLARRVFQVSPLVWPTPQSERPWSAGMWMPRMFPNDQGRALAGDTWPVACIAATCFCESANGSHTMTSMNAGSWTTSTSLTPTAAALRPQKHLSWTHSSASYSRHSQPCLQQVTHPAHSHFTPCGCLHRMHGLCWERGSLARTQPAASVRPPSSPACPSGTTPYSPRRAPHVCSREAGAAHIVGG